MNAWFKQFLESFGECECRKITEKQFDCFARNMHEQQLRGSTNGIRYGMETENLRIRAEKFFKPYPTCYVTIRRIDAEEAEMFEKLGLALTEQIDRLIANGGDDEVIDLLEKYEGLCDEKKQRAMGWI